MADEQRSPAPRTVLVTGGNRGIGRAIAQAFQDAGDNVAVTYRSGEAPEGFFAVQADVTDAASIDAAYKAVEAEFGPVEVVVANAGITRDGLLVRMSEEDFGDVLATNLTATWRLAKRVVPKMMRARWGRIVAVSSVVAIRGNAGQVAYAASKAGLLGMIRSMAKENGGRGITANAVVPGLIHTDMTSGLADKARSALTEDIPAGRTGTPEEVAAPIRFLASEEASYVNGAVLVVDGGLAA
jgi:3-oxoacyl-[acyl-carrier protein] reductase